MKRLLAASSMMVLLLTACGGGVAATVDGVDITVEEVSALRTETVAAAEADFSDDLYNLISSQVATKAANEQFEIEVTDQEQQDELEVIRAELSASGTDLDTRLEELGLSEEFVNLLTRQEVLSRKVTELLVADLPEATEDEVQAVYDGELGAYEAQLASQQEQYEAQLKYNGVTVCSKHILVTTQDEADDAMARLAAGEDFATLATELSIDTGSGAAGGDLGCVSPAQYVGEFADATLEAEIGVPFGPVESQFGFHILLVESRETDEAAEPPVAPVSEPFPAFEDVREDIVASLQAEQGAQAFSEWFIGEMRAAEVTVSEAYGTWTTSEDVTVAPTLDPPSA